MIQEISLGTKDPFAVAYDPGSRMVWVADRGKSVLRVSSNGEILPPLLISAKSLTVSPTTGAVWVGTETDVLRIDSNGEIGCRYAFPRRSSQSWLAAP